MSYRVRVICLLPGFRICSAAFHFSTFLPKTVLFSVPRLGLLKPVPPPTSLKVVVQSDLSRKHAGRAPHSEVGFMVNHNTKSRELGVRALNTSPSSTVHNLQSTGLNWRQPQARLEFHPGPFFFVPYFKNVHVQKVGGTEKTS